MIDALRVCYDVICPELFRELEKLEIGDRYDFYEFSLYRVEGKRFDNVYAIRYHEPGEGDKTFGYLKFNLKSGSQLAENPKAWIWVENWVFYTRGDLHYLSFISDTLGLQFHNITALDLCLDLSWDLPRTLRRLLKRKNGTVILNGKKIHDRDTARPEITYTTSGSLNKTDKYLTVNIKQRKAIKDKAQGITLTAYDKLGEIRNSSGKEYIREAYNHPEKLYRIEIHLNNADIRDYWAKYDRPVEEVLIYNQGLLTVMFIETLNSLVRFDTPEGRVDFETLLGRYITTTPVSDYIRAVHSA